MVPGSKLPAVVTELLAGVAVQPVDMAYLTNMVGETGNSKNRHKDLFSSTYLPSSRCDTGLSLFASLSI